MQTTHVQLSNGPAPKKQKCDTDKKHAVVTWVCRQNISDADNKHAVVKWACPKMKM